ncbi:MAG: hypothetical protein ACI4QL_01390 [Candidatus Fimimonas sp.]
MKNYLENYQLRKKVQLFCGVLQGILCALAVTFLTLFVTTPAPSERNFSQIAIVFTVFFCAHYLAQLVFATITYAQTHPKFTHDKVFVTTSVLALPVATAIYALIVLLIV